MPSHFTKSSLLLCLLVVAGESKKTGSVLQSSLEFGDSSCDPGYNQYCCYNKKCVGSGNFAGTTIKCDQKNHYCTTNPTTGYPICVKNEDGGYWTLCQILGSNNPWYTYGCTYYDDGSVEECGAWLGPLFYSTISLAVVLMVVGIVFRVVRLRRLRYQSL